MSAVHRSRPVQVGPLHFQVESNDPDVVVRFDRLFAGFDDASPTGGAAMSVRITNNALPGGDPAATDRFVTSIGHESQLSSGDLGDHELLLSRLLNDRKLDGEPHLLHLHSAAVARGDRVALLLGRSGTGKTTLAALLLQAGWKYVTDEQVVIRPSDGSIEPYPRPLTVRRQVWPLFPGVVEVPRPSPTDVEWARLEVSPLAFGDVLRTSGARPALVVVPYFEPAIGAVPTRVDGAAKVVAELAACCYDLDRLGLVGFELLVGIAARCPGWHLRYGDPADAVACVDEMLELTADLPVLGVRHIDPVGEAPDPPDGSVRRSESAHAWAFTDGSAVVFDPPTRTLAALDEAGLGAWEALQAPMPYRSLAGDDTEDRHGSLAVWLRTMIARGLVRRA